MNGTRSVSRVSTLNGRYDRAGLGVMRVKGARRMQLAFVLAIFVPSYRRRR